MMLAMGNVTIVDLLVPLLVLLAVVYGLVRFVKWSWNRK
jgi:hypothetical protein